MSEETEYRSPMLRNRDIYLPVIGAVSLLALDAWLFLPGLGLILAILMVLASVVTLLGKLIRRRNGKAKPLLKAVLYALCIAGIFAAHHAHRADARSNALPVIEALRAYHAVNGAYPRNVQELVPRYLSAVPVPTWRYNPGRYHVRVNEATGDAVLWWPAHMRLFLEYDLRQDTWKTEAYD